MKTKFRKLAIGDIVRPGDIIRRPNRDFGTQIDNGNQWMGHEVSKFTPHDFYREVEPKTDADVDPVIAKAKRLAQQARRKTTLGKLEALLTERALWQRKQTIATNKLAETQRKIEALAISLADEKFNSELENQ